MLLMLFECWFLQVVWGMSEKWMASTIGMPRCRPPQVVTAQLGPMLLIRLCRPATAGIKFLLKRWRVARIVNASWWLIRLLSGGKFRGIQCAGSVLELTSYDASRQLWRLRGNLHTVEQCQMPLCFVTCLEHHDRLSKQPPPTPSQKWYSVHFVCIWS